MTSKCNLKWLLKIEVAFRSGAFPGDDDQLSMQLKNEPERKQYD